MAKSGVPLVKRETLTSQVARLIKSEIVSGSYPFGERLIEVELAQKYQITRHVLREALQMLEGEGLVVSDPFCGRSVMRPTTSEMEGLFLLRVSLESVVASLAAHRISSEQAQELRQIHSECAKVPDDYLELVERDYRLHRTIWRIADEPVLAERLEEAVWPLQRGGSLLEVAPEPDLNSAIPIQTGRESSGHPGGHALIVEAICSRDAAAARRRMIDHLIWHPGYSDKTSTAFRIAFSGSSSRSNTEGQKDSGD